MPSHLRPPEGGDRSHHICSPAASLSGDRRTGSIVDIHNKIGILVECHPLRGSDSLLPSGFSMFKAREKWQIEHRGG